MSKNGWVKIDREITEHWLWNDKPFTKGQAWIDLILSVNHTQAKIPINNNIVVIEKGDMLTSIEKLSMRWGWSRFRVKSFLNLLENDKMLVQNCTTHYTTISLTNYSKFQYSSKVGSGTANKQNNNQPLSNPTPACTNNKNKECIRSDELERIKNQ